MKKKNKEVMTKVFAPQFASIIQFMAAYMEYQDRIGR